MTSTGNSHGFIAQAKRQPAKTATLGVMALLMAVIWGRNLSGGEEAKKSSSKSKPELSATESASNSSSSSKSTRTTVSSGSSSSRVRNAPFGSIKNFATAIARLESWRRPLGIEKAVPLTEEYLMARRQEALEQRRDRWQRTQNARKAGERALSDGERGLLAPPEQRADGLGKATPSPETVISSAPLLVDEDLVVDLDLSGTLIFGDTRYALFGDRRVQEGENFGRYWLKAVRPREVDLVVDGMLTVVRISPPDLGGGR
jgi:hypothetical protein